MTTTDSARALNRKAIGLAVFGCLLVAPFITAHATNERRTELAMSADANSFGLAIKRDAKAVGASCREGAHRVAVASKVVAHEIATAAKRGTAETRAAFRGEKRETPSG